MSWYDDPPRDYSDEHANRSSDRWDGVSDPRDCCDWCGVPLQGYEVRTMSAGRPIVICTQCDQQLKSP